MTDDNVLVIHWLLRLPKAELNTKTKVEFLVFKSIHLKKSVPSDAENCLERTFWVCEIQLEKGGWTACNIFFEDHLY